MMKYKRWMMYSNFKTKGRSRIMMILSWRSRDLR